MKRLAMLAAAGVLGLMLAACGENAPKQPEAAKTEATSEAPAAADAVAQAPNEDAAAAAPSQE